ncbi:LppU/SCO3897 family protein [Streptomyces sp. NPDC002671]
MTTPPQGQAPYPPQGQAPYPPQQGYPPQGGAPYPPQQGYPQQGGAPYAPVPPQPKRKLSFKTIKNIVIVVIAAGVAIGGYFASRNDADTAKVGDCMHRGSSSDTSPDLEVVDCGSSKAQYVVLAKVDGKYSGASAQLTCENKAKGFQYAYTEEKSGGSFLLCLKDYKK